MGLITGTQQWNASARLLELDGRGRLPAGAVRRDLADKGERITKETEASKVWLNPRRHWTMDEIWVYKDGERSATFDGVK